MLEIFFADWNFDHSFEIYNIIYALHYTDFRLDTRASRVYMVFYLILLTVTVAAIVLRNAISGRRGKEGRAACVCGFIRCMG